MRNALAITGLTLLLILPGAPSHAAGIDCTKARSPAEKAICATPALLTLDRAVAEAYAGALARAPDRRDEMRQDLLRWLKQRDAACALPGAEIAACLQTQLTARLAALAPPPPPSPPLSPPPSPPPAAKPTQGADATSPATLPVAVPNFTMPPPAAMLDATTLAAAEHAQTLLHVTSPGRFTVAAHSASGASLQLVDMLTGPGDVAGAPGARDGRIDALLDTGTYQLRVASAAGATGPVGITVAPFHDAAAPAAVPTAGTSLATTLRDGEQRAFWVAVPPGGPVLLEAAGRSLADLRLWRAGRELAPLDPVPVRIEPVSGHPLTRLRLMGPVEPGAYLAVAYGGPALPWTDNDAAQPLLLRAGPSPALAEGWAGGEMGPFGSMVFALPAATGLLRLTLPEAAAATLRVGEQASALTRTSREPVASLAVKPGSAALAEISAAAGQRFTLEALAQPGPQSLRKPGTYWVSAVVNGAGGDEAPPAFVLQRAEAADKPPRILASTLPRVGPGAAWHGRFNLRGPTTLLLQNTAGGDLAVRSSGVALSSRSQPGIASLPADYYALTLTPAAGALGSLDIVVGPPGAPPPPLDPLPPNPVIPFGVQTIQPGQALILVGPTAPGLQYGLSARPAPVVLAEGPLTVTQVAGSSLAVPITLAPGGALAVSEIGGGPVPYGLQGDTVVLPIASRTRTLVLAWRRTPVAMVIPPLPLVGEAATLTPSAPAAFTLARDETRGFALNVPEGGLYRIETTGRLHTAGRIATAFIPRLGEAEANGAGANMLLQPLLRAGQYRVDVTARLSAGHAGLSVAPAPTQSGATLVSGGSVRASVPAGSATVFPLVPGSHDRLEVASLGAPWLGRVEDEAGWPMTRTGPLDAMDLALPAGTYRLVVMPDTVARQVVARLVPVAPVVETRGHGPHALPFEAQQTAEWREPAGRGDPRVPDQWVFALAGPADVTIRLGDGMQGELVPAGGGQAVTRFAGSFAGPLDAGQYRLEARSLGRNDRLAYTLSLASAALQPDTPRRVTLPSTIGFALAEPRVASLTSFGTVPVKAVLRQADGRVVARASARADDWNIALSRLLPAGRYTLELASAAPPDVVPVSRNAVDPDAGSDDQADEQAAQTPTRASDSPQADGSGDSTGDASDAPATELRLSLPAMLPAVAAPQDAAVLAGAGVHVLTLPAPAPGSLVLAQAQSSDALVLALERQAAGGWQVVALDTGNAPVVASPADSGSAAWRVEAWSVDGGTAPIRLAARVVSAAAQPPGDVALAAIPGMPGPLAVARVALAGAGPMVADAMLAGGWPGLALTAPNGPILPQDRDLWLLGRTAQTLAVTQAAWSDHASLGLVVPPGQVAHLPAVVHDAQHLPVWIAAAAGQPSFGLAGAVAPGSALVAAGAAASLSGGGDGSLRATVTRQDLALLPPRTLEAATQLLLPPGTAMPVTLPPGDKAMQLDLAPATGALFGAQAAWAGATPLSRSVSGAWPEMIVFNTGATQAAIGISAQPAPPSAPLQAGSIVKRFYGAAGSFELPFDAAAGAHLALAGDAILTVMQGDGSVQTGQDIAAAGAGRVTVAHRAGPVALWMAAEGASPWPVAAAQAVVLPARLPLAGPSMTLALDQPAPSLLGVSTTAPVLLALAQGGRVDGPRMFAAGAEISLVLAPGPAELRLYAPHDGPLAGSAALTAAPLTPIAEGLGDPVSVAPGRSAAFVFEVARAGLIGIGVRAEPDRVQVRLLGPDGAKLGDGMAQLRRLQAGRYVLAVQVPPDSPTTILRPAVAGIAPRGSGPPPEMVRHYLELAGLKPAGDAP